MSTQPVIRKTGGPDLDGNVWYSVAVGSEAAKSGFEASVLMTDRTISARFPAGLGHGSHLVFKGLGAPAKGRQGSAHFVVHIVASPTDPGGNANVGGRISGAAFAIGAASVVISVVTFMFSKQIGGFFIILPIGFLLAAMVQGVHSKKSP